MGLAINCGTGTKPQQQFAQTLGLTPVFISQTCPVWTTNASITWAKVPVDVVSMEQLRERQIEAKKDGE